MEGEDELHLLNWAKRPWNNKVFLSSSYVSTVVEGRTLLFDNWKREIANIFVSVDVKEDRLLLIWPKTSLENVWFQEILFVKSESMRKHLSRSLNKIKNTYRRVILSTFISVVEEDNFFHICAKRITVKRNLKYF